MAYTAHIDNGHTINELEQAQIIDNDSKFLVMYRDRTFNISLSDLRKMMVGDAAVELKDELFYSCKDIDSKLEEIRNIVTGGSQLPQDQINARIDALENDFNAKIDSINTKIDRIMNMIS